jgi:hypothetical protein
MKPHLCDADAANGAHGLFDNIPDPGVPIREEHLRSLKQEDSRNHEKEKQSDASRIGLTKKHG